MAECGVASRRKCDDLIEKGKVRVNGSVMRELGTKIDAAQDEVRLNDSVIKPATQNAYFLLNKPKGYVTTTSDERSRKTVLDLIDSRNRIFPVGRLDKDTSGLLLLTDDGELTYKLTHPSFNIDKIYEVNLNRELQPADKEKLESGIKLEEGITSECTIEFPRPANRKFVEMRLHQGWKRQIRRMFAKLNYEVLNLKRTGLAFLDLKGIKPGQWRRLTEDEVHRLKHL